MAKINGNFADEIKKYGGINFNACYNCGNCTAVCSLSDENNSFPRKMVRYSVLGNESKLKMSLEPWLCYYCGECSSTCPREANPGELMMSLRRWLTAKYDWTGLSGLLYKSITASILAFVLLALGIIWYAFKLDFNIEKLLHYGHYFEIIAISIVFLFILLPDIIHMWWLTIFKQKVKVSILSYIKVLGELFEHMFTQKQTLGCEDSYTRWLEHLILVIGYLSLLFTTVFLNWLGTQNNFIIILGYTESAAIFIITFIFMAERIKKSNELSKHSHPSDWFFVIWLFLMALSAFFARLFIDLNIIESNIWIYIIHIIVLVQWALIIVPFGKWTHFLYRSFAMYFNKLKT